MDFEWDEDKATSNLKIHKVKFDEAATVFGDFLSVTFPDPDHSVEEDRFITIGTSEDGHILIVSHTDREDRIRIISAPVPARRPAAKGKRRKKKTDKAAADDLRAEYDAALIRGGVRGKYAARDKAGTNLVLLAPDVAAALPDAKAVNEALRMLMKVANKSVSGSRK